MKKAEQYLESFLFGARWLAAPFYIGLLAAVVMLFVVFLHELASSLPMMLTMDPNAAILSALTLIDLTLAANLVLIVVLAGYETFVSKIETGNHEDRPAWMGTIGFSGVKLKLFASIVAISGIQLLKSFMAISTPNAIPDQNLFWLTVIHLTFVATTVLSALTDWLSSRAKDAGA